MSKESNINTRAFIKRIVVDLAHAVIMACHGSGSVCQSPSTPTQSRHPDVASSTTTLYLNADNFAVVYLNGKRIATTDSTLTETPPNNYYGWQKTTAVVVADWQRGSRSREYEIVVVCENASGIPTPAGIVATLVTTHYDAHNSLLPALTLKHDSTGGTAGPHSWSCVQLATPTNYPYAFGPHLSAADVPGYTPNTLHWVTPTNQGAVDANTTWGTTTSPAVFDLVHFDTTSANPAQWIWTSDTRAGANAQSCATVAFRLKGTT